MSRRLGPYRLFEEIGRGGMGIIWRAVHQGLDREVAIKALPAELTGDPQFKERFFAEARTQARFQHPNIVTVHDLLEEGEETFLVMELFRGQSLEALLADPAGEGGLPEPEALGLFTQVLAALDAAHRRGIIHRDVKPANILVGERGEVKLTDFGIALLVGNQRLTVSSQTIGTPLYMSPEQILRPREIDHRTDLYSAAIVLFEMLTGRPPFLGPTQYEIHRQHIETPPGDLAGALAGASPPVREAVLKAMAKDPAARFQSAGAFARALVAEPAGVEPPPSPPRPAPPDRMRRWLVPALGGTALLAAVLAAVLLPGSGERGRPVPPPSAPPPAVTAGTVPVDEASFPPPTPGPPAGVEEEGGAGSPSPPVRIEARPESPLPRPDPREAERLIRQRKVAALARALPAGLAEARKLLADGKLDEARDKVRELVGRVSPYRADLIGEVVALDLLADEITAAIVARETATEKVALARKAWDDRIGEIETLLAEATYPEAKRLAERLLEDPALPADLATRARELAAEAEQKLRGIWGDTEAESTTEVVNPRTRKKKGGGSREP